ncbi:MAG TPA: flagellar basal body rod C-terminal domain-containing protein [Xanthomonadaceae bacterium]|jgi:flagellar basal-body rod protein FlgC
MPIESILDASRSALTYERLRLDAASRNIAGANVPIAPGHGATQLVVGGDFAQALGEEPAVTESPIGTRDVYDPGHPMADASGMVHYPATDLVQEMTTLVTASRSYEANVRSFNILRAMMLRALDIGGH